MKKKTKNIVRLLLATAIVVSTISSCKDDINGDYYPPVLKIGFEDTSDVTINNNDKNHNGGADSSYVRVFKIISDNTNNVEGIDCFFDLVNVSTDKVDTTAVNTYVRLLNPVVRRDSIKTNGQIYARNMWSGSRAVIDKAQRSTAVMMRSIDYVPNVPKNSPSSYTFLLKLIPDKSTPIKYVVDPLTNTKKVTVIDGKMLTSPIL